MLVGRCSSQLSGHQNDERNQKVTTSERSASQIYRVVQRLVARSRRNPEGAYLVNAVRSFSTILWEVEEKHPKKTTPNRLTLVGLRPGLGSAVPVGLSVVPYRARH